MIHFYPPWAFFAGIRNWYFNSDIHMLHWSLITCYDFMQCSFLQCHHWKATRNVCYFLNNSIPISFYNFFVTRYPIHYYHTRSVDLIDRFYRTNLGQFSVMYRGPVIRNSFSASIRSQTSFLIFKKRASTIFLKCTVLCKWGMITVCKHCKCYCNFVFISFSFS